MAKVLCVSYDDPVDGYPPAYARHDIPKLERYPGGQTVPSPKQIDFKPGERRRQVSGVLGHLYPSMRRHTVDRILLLRPSVDALLHDAAEHVARHRHVPAPYR